MGGNNFDIADVVAVELPIMQEIDSMTFTQRLVQLSLIAAVAIAVSGASATQADTWSLNDEQEYTVGEGTRPIALSPDGLWLAGIGEGQDFCIWSLPDLDEYCDDATFFANENTVAWAPDSSQVAFADNPAKFLTDSDIMVFDVESKEIVNLTDDPNELQDIGFGSADPGVTHADTYPYWSADGQTLYFIRGDRGSEGESTKIMSLDVASGEITDYFTISPDLWFTAYTPMFETSDGSLLISIFNYDEDDEQDDENKGNGIWRIAPGGSEIDPVLESGTDEDLEEIALVDVSADGSTAIVSAPEALNSYLLLDLESGEVTSFPDPDDSWQAVVPNPQFLGDGTDVVFEVAFADVESFGVVVGLDDPIVLTDSLDKLYAYGLQTSDDGSILVRGTNGHATVLWIEGGETPPCGCTPPEGN